MEMWVHRQLSKNVMQHPTLGPHRPVLWMEQLPGACLRRLPWLAAPSSLAPAFPKSPQHTKHLLNDLGATSPPAQTGGGVVGWRPPSHPASTRLMRPHTQKGRKGVTTMPPACAVTWPFCPKALIPVAALIPDN